MFVIRLMTEDGEVYSTNEEYETRVDAQAELDTLFAQAPNYIGDSQIIVGNVDEV